MSVDQNPISSCRVAFSVCRKDCSRAVGVEARVGKDLLLGSPSDSWVTGLL